MAGVIATIPKFQFSANGVPMVGGTLDTYIAGSTTPATTWQDSALTIANTNPISLDARGECVLWLDPAVVYKFVLKNAQGVIQWTQDNISNPAALANSLRADLAASSGASLVGFQQAGTGAVARTAQDKMRELVSPKDFGAVGNGVTDDTIAVQAAIDYAKSTAKNLAILGDYKVSKAVFDTCSGLTVYCAGNLIGSASGSYEAVLVVKNSADITFLGRLGVSAVWNSGYTSAVAVYTDNGTQAATLQFEGVSPIGAKLGWKFGRTSEPDPLISEITVKGGFLYGCPSAVEAIGSQTFVSFVGCQLITGTNGGSGAWLSLPRVCVKSIGAYVTLSGGEALITDVINGAAFQIEPIASVTYGNAYGTIVATGVVVESASQYGAITNPGAIGSVVPGSGRLQLTNCGGYHSQNSFPMVNSASDFSGVIAINGCNFYGGIARSQPNISCAGNADVWCDDLSFGKNFAKGLVGVTGGILHFPTRTILNVANANSQAFPLGTATVIKFISLTNSPDTQRFNANYSAATGVFTVPAGGLRSVSVGYVLRTSQPSQPLDVALHLNGSFYSAFPTMMGGAANGGFARGYVMLGDLPEGTTIDLRATQSGAASVANGGAFEGLTISATN